jgi:hypothetical protein
MNGLLHFPWMKMMCFSAVRLRARPQDSVVRRGEATGQDQRAHAAVDDDPRSLARRVTVTVVDVCRPPCGTQILMSADEPPRPDSPPPPPPLIGLRAPSSHPTRITLFTVAFCLFLSLSLSLRHLMMTVSRDFLERFKFAQSTSISTVARAWAKSIRLR